MNCVRRHLSAIKGGRLAAACHPARVLTLMISDVPGDRPIDIASGPTVADPTTCADALGILRRYAIDVPDAVRELLESGRGESVKPGDPRLSGAEARIIATPQMALEAAAAVARAAGVTPHILGDAIEGEARDVGTVLAGIALQVAERGQPFAAPCVLLSGGETTVTVRGKGRGGRNVEFLLSLAIALDGHPRIHALAGDTDGVDGQEEIAGASIAPDTLARAWERGLRPKEMLADNDAHSLFTALGDSVITGPTLTNVNDFRAIFITGDLVSAPAMGHDLHDRTRPVAAVDLPADQEVPAVAACAVRARQRVDHGAAGDAGAGSRLHGGDADGLVGNQVPQHRESLELPVEKFSKRLRRHIVGREAGAAGGDDDVHGGIVDPQARLPLNRRLVAAHQRACPQLMARGGDPLGQQDRPRYRWRASRESEIVNTAMPSAVNSRSGSILPPGMAQLSSFLRTSAYTASLSSAHQANSFSSSATEVCAKCRSLSAGALMNTLSAALRGRRIGGQHPDAGIADDAPVAVLARAAREFDHLRADAGAVERHLGGEAQSRLDRIGSPGLVRVRFLGQLVGGHQAVEGGDILRHHRAPSAGAAPPTARAPLRAPARPLRRPFCRWTRCTPWTRGPRPSRP